MPASSSWSPAPVPAAGLDRALRPLGEATMLPAEAYASPEVLAWERRHLFAGCWTCAGRVEDLFTGGQTQRALTVGDVSVLCTRVAGGTVAAFANTCRHRGHELLPHGDTADRPSVVCPYHGWSYRLNGELRAAPGFRDVSTFDPRAYGLVAVPVQVWHGWVFIAAIGGTPPLADYLGAVADLVAPYAPERLRLAARHHYEVRANWKVMVENYHECYHCPLIHPELCQVSPPASGDNYDLPGAWVGGTMSLRDGAETMSLSGRCAGTFLPGVDQRSVGYLGLFPNLLLSLHPDYVMAHRLEPVAPDLTTVECSWYLPASVSDPTYAVEFWDRTNRQDWAACESVQRGLASPHFQPGPFAPNEDAVHQWVAMVARAYRGEPPWT